MDTDGLTAASITGAVKSNTDWLRRLADIALNIFSSAATWTAAQAFPAGTTIALPTIVTLNNSGGSAPTADPVWTVNGGGGSAYLRYFKDALGFVVLEGYIYTTAGVAAPSANSGRIFVLPAGFRPANTIYSHCTYQAGGGALGSGGESAGDLQVDTSGNVYVPAIAGLTYVAVGFNIRFRQAN